MSVDPARLAALGLPLLAMGAMLAHALTSLESERVLAEISTAQSDQLLRGTSAALTRHLSSGAPATDAIAPRAAMVRAAIRARAAATTEAPQIRAWLLDGAAADAARAVAAMPHSGQAWLASSFVAYLRDGPSSPAARDGFARSYAGNPYLHDSIDWRLRYAAAQWQALPAETRAAVALEGEWYARLERTNRTHVYVLTGGTPVWRAIAGSDAPPRVPRPL